MSFRYYRRYVYGNPQRRIFLPNFWMKLVPNEVEKPSNFVQFICPLEMTNRDIKNYLEKIYKVPVIDVQTIARDAPIVKSIKGYLIKKEDDYRAAFVQLPVGTKFEFPELFPEEKKKEKQEDYDRETSRIDKLEEEYSKKIETKKSLPSWF